MVSDSCPFEFIPEKWTMRIEFDGEPAITNTFEVYK